MDDVKLTALSQRFEDFMRDTIDYRKEKQIADKDLATDLKLTNRIIFGKLEELKTVLDKLPCESHKGISDKIHEALEKTDSDQWWAIRYLWGAVVFVACIIIAAGVKSLIK
jgi:hypothetical protein